MGDIFPLNIFKSERRYCQPFSNAAVPNERIYPNFAIKSVAIATSFEETGKEVRIVHIHVNTYRLVKKMVKIGPVDPEIIGLKLKKKLTQAKYNSPVGKFAE